MENRNKPYIRATCPVCSQQESQLHLILKQHGTDLLVKCTNCGSVHTIVSKAARTITTRIIVSKGEHSTRYTIELPSDHEVGVGDDLLVDDPSADEVHLAEVASIESYGKRVPAAIASDIDTIWARAIDEVTVKIAIHDGVRTESDRLQVFGDREFTVGDIEAVRGKKFRIVRIKTHKSGFKKFKGDVVLAKDIKRIFAEKV